MLFSLHRSSARLFRTLVVEPHSAQRVYLRLYLDLSDAADSSTGDGGPCLHRIEAYINCRLVKDFQKQINIDAYCRRPSLRLSSSEFRFDGSLSKQVADASREAKQGAALLSMEPADGHQLAVTNVCDHAVPLLVVNDTRFFSVAQPALPIARGATVSIDIALNADEIRDNLAFLQKVEESREKERERDVA